MQDWNTTKPDGDKKEGEETTETPVETPGAPAEEPTEESAPTGDGEKAEEPKEDVPAV